MGIIQDKVTPEFKKWEGYCEKNKKSQIGTYENPEDYKKNAGTGNYTVFAELYKPEIWQKQRVAFEERSIRRSL